MLPTLLEAKAEVDALIIHSGESGLFSPHALLHVTWHTVDSITRRRTCSAETMQYTYLLVATSVYTLLNRYFCLSLPEKLTI